MKSRALVAGTIGGIAAIVVLVILVLLLGRNDPSPPSLQDDPNPAIPGAIIFGNNDGCIEHVQASGAGRREVICIPPSRFMGGLRWLDAETIRYVQRLSDDGAALERVTVDLATGAITGREPATGEDVKPGGIYGSVEAPDGTTAAVESGGRLYLYEDGRRTEIADFDTGSGSQPQALLWSPDSRWLLLTYYPPRGDRTEIWVIARDGSVRGTLTTNFSWWAAAAWWMDGFEPQPATGS